MAQGLDNNFLQKFQDVENMSELRSAALAEDNDPVNAQTSTSCVDTELQKFLPTLEKSTTAPNDAAFVYEVMITKQPTGLVDTTPTLGGGTEACIPGRDPKLVNRAGTDRGQMVCRHLIGEYHHEVINRWLWSTLPQELVEIIFAKLSMPKIIDLIRDSEVWSALSESSNFRQFCSERHPKLFSLMRWDSGNIERDTVRATVFDITSNEWVGSFDLVGFPASGRCSGGHVDHGYDDSMYAHDGGLVCFVPPSDLTVAPVLVCNPLTREWRSLPLIPHEHKRIILVQLVVDMDTKSYKVMLVCSHTRMKQLHLCMTPTPDDTAHCYHSSTGVWSTMDTGFVHGGGGSLQQRLAKVPCVFDCKKKVFYYLKYHIPFRQPFGWSGVNDCLVVLYDSKSISEFAWRCSRYSIQSTMELGPYRSKPPHQVFLFAIEDFFLVIGDSSVKTRGKHGQIIQVYDRCAKRWHRASPMAADENSHPDCLQKAFTCELRWDAIP